MSPRERGTIAPTSPLRMRGTERQARALAMRLEGASTPDIARELGVTRQTAWKMLDKALRARREEIGERTETLRAVEVERVEEYIRALRPAALAGDLNAHRALIRWHERLARLQDLDLRREVETPVPEITVLFALPGDRERDVVEDATFEEVEPLALPAGEPGEEGAPDA